MATDHYAPCPCGSGKKLKFCKCVDNTQDLDKINRLIDGGQEVAALDRINQLLKKTPNAAWLLAIKAELALAMSDFEMFRDAAVRFHKLKPDNPLALIMQSLVCGQERGKYEQSASYLLQGLAESRESLSHLALFAVRVLLDGLAREAKSFMGCFWDEFLLSLSRRSGNDYSIEFPQNLVLRANRIKISEVPNAPWKERMNEVEVLIRSYRLEQAEKKLQSILRDYPDQPVPLIRLLEAQYGLLNQAGAAQTALKLSELQALPTEERARYYAIWLELEPEQTRLQLRSVVRYAAIDSEHRVLGELAKLDVLHDITASMVGYMALMVGSEVPPQAVFGVRIPRLTATHSGDEEAGNPEYSSESLPTTDAGVIAIFGKETDQPARAAVMLFDIRETRSVVQQILESLQLGEEVASPIANNARIARMYWYTQYLSQVSSVSHDGPNLELVDDFLSIPFNDLNEQTLIEAAKDERLGVKVRGHVLHLEGAQTLVFSDSTMDEIYNRLGLQRTRIHLSPEVDQYSSEDALDFIKLDLTGLHNNVILGLFEQARVYSLARLLNQTAEIIVQRQDSIEPREMVIGACLALVQTGSDLDKRLQLLATAEQLALEAEKPVGELVVLRSQLLASYGKTQEAAESLRSAMEKYPEDPFLINFLQMLGQRSGGQAEAVQPVEAPRPSGLVLPGGQPVEAAPATESKLWLPGT